MRKGGSTYCQFPIWGVVIEFPFPLRDRLKAELKRRRDKMSAWIEIEKANERAIKEVERFINESGK